MFTLQTELLQTASTLLSKNSFQESLTYSFPESIRALILASRIFLIQGLLPEPFKELSYRFLP